MLEGKKILVTGATGGIGRIVAARARELGGIVVGTTHGDTFGPEMLRVDFCDDPQTCWCGLTGFDGIVHCAWADEAAPMVPQMDVGPRAFKELVQRNAGTLRSAVAIGSIITRQGSRGLEEVPWEYAAAKGALVTTVRWLAMRYAKTGIRVNLVTPGLVPVGMSADRTDLRVIARQMPQGRLCSAEDIAEAVCFLLSEHSRYISGADIPVTGALTA